MLFLYNLSIRLYVLAIRIASLWNAKAKLWIDGRKDLFERLRAQIGNTSKVIWMHCASAGEFEQGKPVIERLKKEYPHHKILVTFFSPSGYQVAKKYTHADFISYLPVDTGKNAQTFLDIVNPELVVFVKYEFWYHFLAKTAFRHIPLLIVSAIFRKDQLFFKWYGSFYKKLLFLFRHIFVQDDFSLQLLKANGLLHCSIGGDTRFDRVKEIAGNFKPIPALEHFVQDKKTIMAGSTWPQDEKFLAGLHQQNFKLVIAPHEIDKEHISSIQRQFPEAVLFSQVKEAFENNIESPLWSTVQKETGAYLKQRLGAANVLIIDNIGMLSRLYYYATITYVGGGFSKGIHNTLEAAVYGKPVLFGPNFQKFKEAKDLVNNAGAFTFNNQEELNELVNGLLTDEKKLHQSSEASKKYIEENVGATDSVIQFIQANRLLTK